MATVAIMPCGETVADFPERAQKPKAYDYDAMAKLEMPYKFSFPSRAEALRFRNTVFRPMRVRGIKVRLFNRLVYLRLPSQGNHYDDCNALTK